MIMLKTTHEGIDAPRRLTAVREPTEAAPISSAGEGSEKARAAGRCAVSRASVQAGFADI